MAQSRAQLDQVQFLRGIAAFSILIAHTPYLQGGHFGVDLFFVISGFIMMYVTERSHENFLLKRAVRIIPLYWLGTLGLYSLTWIAPGLLNTASTDITHLLKSLFFIPYFNGTTIEPLLRLGWTLNYEVFFYLVFFISMSFNHRYRAAVTTALLLSFVLVGQLIQPEHLVAQFYSNPILLEFVYGMLAFYVFRATQSRRESMGHGGARVCAVLGTGLYIAMFFIPWPEDYSIRYLMWGLPSLLVFMLVAIGGSNVKTLGFFVLLGNVSYSLYLLHPYVIHLIDRKIHSISEPGAMTFLATFAAYALSIVVAYISWRLIEQQSQRYLMSKWYRYQGKPSAP
ncbi:O-acetyltransferase OatA [Halioglobus japonicus]|nr:O-acetyltransferase OatA [Halioglobus japonicus]